MEVDDTKEAENVSRNEHVYEGVDIYLIRVMNMLRCNML